MVGRYFISKAYCVVLLSSRLCCPVYCVVLLIDWLIDWLISRRKKHFFLMEAGMDIWDFFSNFVAGKWWEKSKERFFFSANETLKSWIKHVALVLPPCFTMLQDDDVAWCWTKNDFHQTSSSTSFSISFVLRYKQCCVRLSTVFNTVERAHAH